MLSISNPMKAGGGGGLCLQKLQRKKKTKRGGGGEPKVPKEVGSMRSAMPAAQFIKESGFRCFLGQQIKIIATHTFDRCIK